MLGLLFSYTVGTLLPWRALSAVCAAVPLLCVLCLAAIPRSPAFLLSTGDREAARSSLQYYRGPRRVHTFPFRDLAVVEFYYTSKHVSDFCLEKFVLSTNVRRFLNLEVIL